MSIDVVKDSTAEEIAQELQISKFEAQCLKHSETDWQQSLGYVLQKIRDNFGDLPVTRTACETILQVADCREHFTHLSAANRGRIPLAIRSWLTREAYLSGINGATLTPDNFTDINAARFTATAEQPAQEIAAGVLLGNAPALSSREMAIEEHLSTEVHCISNDKMDTGEAENVLNAGIAGVGSDQMLSSCDPMHVPGSDSSATGNFGQPQLVIGQRLKFQSDGCEDWQAGTVMYANDSDCIGLMDDYSVLQIQRNKMSNFTLIGGATQPEIESSLVAVILKDPRDESLGWIRKFISTKSKEKSALAAVACASQVLTEKYACIQFTEVLGNGGYGTVLRAYNSQCSEHVAVKMELCTGCPDVKFQSLWRESNILCKPSKELEGYLPKLKKIFGAHAYVRVWDGVHTVGFLAMEILLPYAKDVFDPCNLINGRYIPDSFRHLAQEQCIVLKNCEKAGIHHGDLKLCHWMQRPCDAHLVLIDFGLSERRDWSYRENLPVDQISSQTRQILTASDALPSICGMSPLLKRLGRDRPGTIGFRPQNAACSPDDRHKADVWALAVGWMAGVGVAPRGSKDQREQFENSLYEASITFDAFLKWICCQRLTNSLLSPSPPEDIDKSGIRWLKFIYFMLKHGMPVLRKLQSNPALAQPFYHPTMLEKLRTTGIIIPGLSTQKDNFEVKPLLVMQIEEVGIVVLCLLYYNEDECLALYGGKRMPCGSAEAVFSATHNMPLGDGHVLLGAVSKHYSIQDFIDNSAVGSFIKSSNVDPHVQTAGTLHLPDRYRPRNNLTKGMEVVCIRTRVQHGPGMQPTYPYDWNAGSGDSIFDANEVEVLQRLVARPLPDYVWRAVADARMAVLNAGKFRDAEISDRVKANLLPEEMPAEIRKYLSLGPVTPLSPQLVMRIESDYFKNDGIKYPRPEWSEIDAEILEKDELISKGIPFFENVPERRSNCFEQALLADSEGSGGQGIVFLDASKIALKSLKRLKEVPALGDTLYGRICQHSQPGAEAGPDVVKESSHCPAPRKARATRTSKWSKRKQSGKKGTQRGKSASKEAGDDSSGAGGQPEPTIAAWLLIVLSYLSSVPDELWSVIFQQLEGTDDVRTGDGRRSELKGDKWPRPERESDESEDSFHDKLAGFYALSFFFDDLFDAIVNILPDCACIVTRLLQSLKSILGSDSTLGSVQAQEPHNDKKPVLHQRCYSVLINLSRIVSYLGIMMNSCPNIKHMLQHDEECFDFFRQRFMETMSVSEPTRLLSDVLGTGELDGKIRFAWMHHLAEEWPEQFKDMFPVYAKMSPLMVALFDTDCTHWGPPFPMPNVQYPQHYQLIHFRCDYARLPGLLWRKWTTLTR